MGYSECAPQTLFFFPRAVFLLKESLRDEAMSVIRSVETLGGQCLIRHKMAVLSAFCMGPVRNEFNDICEGLGTMTLKINYTH